MSRKHFIKLAGYELGQAAMISRQMTLSENRTEQDLVLAMAQDIAGLCAESNSNFDRSRWYQAAGVDQFLKG